MRTFKQSLKSIAAVMAACGLAASAFADGWASHWLFEGGLLTETDEGGAPVAGGWVFAVGGNASSISLSDIRTVGTSTQLDFSDLALTSIGQNACKGNKVFTDLKFPACLTFIDHWAFTGCSSLRSVDFGSDSELTFIGSECFNDCKQLTTVTPLLPEKLRSTWTMFKNCPLEGDLRLGYGAASGFSIGSSTFEGHKLTSVDLGPKVTGLGHWVFQSSNNSTLTSVRMSDDVTSIGQNVFNGCSALRSIVPLAPKGLTGIQPSSYASCGVEGTMAVATGDAVFGMTAGNFARYTKIDTLVLGANFTGVFSGHWQFGSVSTLKYIKVKGDNVFNFTGNCGAFEGMGAYRILVTVPGKSAAWQTVLGDTAQVKPWKDVDQSAKDAFHANFPTEGDPDGLIVTDWSTSGWFGTGNTLVNQWIASDAKATFVQVVGDPVTAGEPSPAYGVTQAADLTYPLTCTADEYSGDDTTLRHCTGYELSYYEDGEWTTPVPGEGNSVTIPNDEKSVRVTWKFEEVAYKAKVIVDPAQGAVVEDSMPDFRGYYTVGETATYTASGANFSRWYGDVDEAQAANATLDVLIDGPKTIMPYFRNDWVMAEDGKTMSDGYWTVSVGGSAAARHVTGCVSGAISLLDLAKPVSDSSVITYIGQSAFSGNANIETLLLPASLVTIDHYAFQNCPNLASVDFGGADSQLTTLGCVCFAGCSKLKKVTPLLPEKVCSTWENFNGSPIEGDLRLGYGAERNFNVSSSMFNGHKLTSVDLGPKVTGLGHWVFQSSYNETLKSVKMTDNVTSIGQAVFNGCLALKTISPLVPKGLTGTQLSSYASCGVEGTMEFGTGTNVLSMSEGNFIRYTKLERVVFGENFTGVFSGHWQFGGISTLKYIDTYGDNVFDFSGNCGTFDGMGAYQMLLTVPQESASWEAVMADPEQVTPWSELDDTIKAEWYENFPGMPRPVGLVISHWSTSSQYLGTGNSLVNQWIRRRPMGGMMLLFR